MVLATGCPLAASPSSIVAETPPLASGYTHHREAPPPGDLGERVTAAS